MRTHRGYEFAKVDYVTCDRMSEHTAALSTGLMCILDRRENLVSPTTPLLLYSIVPLRSPL